MTPHMMAEWCEGERFDPLCMDRVWQQFLKSLGVEVRADRAWQQFLDVLIGHAGSAECPTLEELQMPLHIEYELTPSDLPKECIHDCSAQGAVDESVAYWVKKLGLTVNQKRAKQCLKATGAYDAEELEDEDQNVHRILWLACCGFNEGSDLFVMEG